MNLTTNITDKEMGVDKLPHTELPYQMALLVADNLQAIRDYYKQPVSIHVGYRDEDHNLKVGGVATSQHLFGEAVDFHVANVNLQKVFNDCVSGRIKFPHKISQIILEESKVHKGQWGWIHMGVFTDRWSTSRKSNKKSYSGNEYLLAKNGGYFVQATELV